MLVRLPALPFAADPLIAEAKLRARRRRLLAMAVVVVAGAVAGTTVALQAGGSAVGLCTTPPAGWKERSIPRTSTTEATVVLTTFRFGQLDNFYGLASRLHWPAGGAMIAVSNDGPDATPRFKRALRVAAADFSGFEGMHWPGAAFGVRSGGRVLSAYVEVRTVTPATIAAVNAALAGIHTCSA